MKKYRIQITSLDSYTLEPHSFVSLDDYLSPTYKREVTRKKRMGLALSLSLAILQLYTTPWISMWWTWKDFCVLDGDRPQIFIMKKFYSIHSPLEIGARTKHPVSTSAFWYLIGEPVLTRLGFALVELALGQKLSELRQEETPKCEDEDMMDLLTARQLVNEGRVLDEAGQCYNDAVKACLTHQVFIDGRMRSLNSKNVDFQLNVEKFVVSPIQDFYQASWGSIPELEVEA
jgi:hypothetical protein